MVSGGTIRTLEKLELLALLVYAFGFYFLIIRRSLQLSHDHSWELSRLRPGWMWNRLNDVSDAQWRNFRANLPILSTVLGVFTFLANALRSHYQLRSKGMSAIWLLFSLSYLLYLHGACVLYIFFFASINFLFVKVFAKSKHFSYMIWLFNLSVLLSNRVFGGYSFSSIRHDWAFMDEYRGTFRWHICFNFVTLRMISFGYDYFWATRRFQFDEEKHSQRCQVCRSGKTCYLILQERPLPLNEYSFLTYMCYLVYAPLYIAGPIVTFNSFASQLRIPQKNYSVGQIFLYGCRWTICLFLIEAMTHFFYYNSFCTSDLWRQLTPFDIFIVGYGVLNFMWLKFLLIWRYFRLWALIGGVESPENMPKCINNCYDLESFWKSWHASFNKWLVRYMYIPLGGSHRKILNVWVIFTFVALWHDLEWKLIFWAWLTCIFMIPGIVAKYAFSAFQADHVFAKFILRELKAVAGAITITCLMVTNLVGYVIGPSNITEMLTRLKNDGLKDPVAIFITFYVGTKLMFHIRDAKQISC